jgi:hypothetical protein
MERAWLTNELVGREEMQDFATIEALGWALLDVSDVVVREPLGDASKRRRVVEKLARQCEASCRVDGEVNALDPCGVPLDEPSLERLRSGTILITLRVGNGVPDPKHGDLVQPEFFHALLAQTMDMRQYDE